MNALHIIGISLLVGGAVPICIRILGFWRSLPLEPSWNVLAGTSITGFIIAAGSGLLLFAAGADNYVKSPIFTAKMALIPVALCSMLLLGVLIRNKRSRIQGGDGEPNLPVRMMSLPVIVLWLSILVLGRLLGYF
ncbi:MAG: hypothetical protein ACOC2H_00510 [Spirochaetota bacterium]